MKTWILFFGGTLLSTSQLPAQSTGSLDTSFGAQITSFSSLYFTALAAQPDGKIVVGGLCKGQDVGSQFLARLNTDGTLDGKFNADGIRCTSDDSYGSIQTIALQSTGKIIIGGRGWEAPDFVHFSLARLNLDGSVDRSFAQSGENWFAIRKVVSLPSGGCYIGSWSGLHRLKPNGELDSTFNPKPQVFNDFAVQPDGRVVASLPRTFVNVQTRNVIRLLPDGGYDPSFKNVLTDKEVRFIKIFPDGKILLGGAPELSGAFSSVNGIARPQLARLEVDGLVDLNFTPFTDDLNPTYTAIQRDGKIILPQFWKTNGLPVRQLVRLNTNGSRDETYISELRHEIQLHDGFDDFQVLALVIQPDEKLVVATTGRDDEGMSVSSIIRLHGDGLPYIVPASVHSNSGQTIEFQITASTNRTVVVESSADLKNGPWQVLATYTPAMGREIIHFLNSDSKHLETQFYRAVSP